MQDASLYLLVALSALAAIAIVAHAVLRGWAGWLDLKRAELERWAESPPSSTASRIEFADMRERVRKLEAIAAGVDI